MLYAMNKKPEVVEQLQELYDNNFLGEGGEQAVETMIAMAGNDTSAEVEPVVPVAPVPAKAAEDEGDDESDPLEKGKKEKE